VENEECTATAHCINCRGSHRPNNRQCPIYKKEVEVIRLKVDKNLTYPEARKRIEAGTANYAAAAAQQTADRKKMEELEKKMEAKDAQIAQLLNAMKIKDEKIDKLLAHIRQIRTPANQQVQPTQQSHHPAESTESPLPTHIARKARESQVAASSMQLRTRSPATTEPSTKEHSKKKRHNRSNNTSPGRQSPPPKKTVEKNMFIRSGNHKR
jgi:hypothetical protein